MILHKGINSRDHIIVPGLLNSVSVREQALDFSVVINDQPVSVSLRAVLTVAVVVTQVIFRHNERLFTFRKIDSCIFLEYCIAVLVSSLHDQIVETYDNVTGIVHILYHNVELTYSRHGFVVLLYALLRAGGGCDKTSAVIDQRMPEDVGGRRYIDLNTAALLSRYRSKLTAELRVRVIAVKPLDRGDRAVIIILHRLISGIVQNFLFCLRVFCHILHHRRSGCRSFICLCTAVYVRHR